MSTQANLKFVIKISNFAVYILRIYIKNAIMQEYNMWREQKSL